MPTSFIFDYWRQWRRFLHSYYLYEGVRVTLGILTPVLLGFYTRHAAWGLAAAMGALAAAITDFAGPLRHRVNGILAVGASLFLTTYLVHLLSSSPLGLALLVLVLGFLFSIITLYGARAAQVGTATLVVFTLALGEENQPLSYPQLAFWQLTGVLAYLVLSVLLQRLRPYQLARQAIAECLLKTEAYLEAKKQFFTEPESRESLTEKLALLQLEVNHAQQNAREILFKTRSITRESTQASKMLVLSFLESVDLYDGLLALPVDSHWPEEGEPWTTLRQRTTEYLEAMGQWINATADALAAGRAYPLHEDAQNQLTSLLALAADSRSRYLNSRNIESFVAVHLLLESINRLVHRIHALQTLTLPARRKLPGTNINYRQFVVPSNFSVSALARHLNLHSNVFRFSLRMALAMLAGYILCSVLPIGHSHWVLLTIVVILKPAYAITKKRNQARLLGTLLGAAVGAGLLLWVSNDSWLLAITVVCMIAAFSLWRHRYFWSVLAITVFVLLSMQLLGAGSSQMAVQDRVMDTLLGSAIAFLATWAIPPHWEANQLPMLAVKALETSRQYLLESGKIMAQPEGSQVYRLARKNAYVDLANLTDAFERMTNEPKSQQQNAPEWQQLVATSHVLLAQMAALRAETVDHAGNALPAEAQRLLNKANDRLVAAKQCLDGNDEKTLTTPVKSSDSVEPNTEVGLLLARRRMELEEGRMETATKNELITLKTLLDPMEKIAHLSEELYKLCKRIAGGDPLSAR